MNDLERSLAFKPVDAMIRQVKVLDKDELVKFSVVIPTLNQASYIRQALDSVIAQEYPQQKLEILVVDGGSSDGTLRILQEFEEVTNGLVRFISGADKGQFHAVNKGIKQTSGDIVAWLNSDDVYLDNCFWRVATFFHFNRSAMIVYGRNKYTNEKLEGLFDYPVDWSPLLSEQRRKMMHFCLPPQPSLFFRREAVSLAGALQSPILDYELWLRWQRDFQFYFLDDYLSLSRLHDEAKTIRERRELIMGILRTVHDFYNIVPMSWTMSLAYHEEYGNAWQRGETHYIGRKLKITALLYWVRFNLLWLPKSISRLLSSATRLIMESLQGTP